MRRTYGRRPDLMVAIAAAFLIRTAAAAQIPDSADVARVVESYHAAEKAGDSTAMLALLSDDAVILESGGIEAKAAFRGGHLRADIAFIRSVQVERSALRVRVRGDAAWVTSTSTTQGESNGRTINSIGAELMVLAREIGRLEDHGHSLVVATATIALRKTLPAPNRRSPCLPSRCDSPRPSCCWPSPPAPVRRARRKRPSPAPSKR